VHNVKNLLCTKESALLHFRIMFVSEWSTVLIAGAIKKVSHNAPQLSRTKMP